MLLQNKLSLTKADAEISWKSAEIKWAEEAIVQKQLYGDCFLPKLSRLIKPGSVQLQLTQLKMSTGKTGVQRGRHKFTNSDMK